MQTKNLKCFFVWYVITCHLTTNWALRNRFSAISFHDYLHYCGIFLARFLIKIVLNINLSLHIVFSLCTRVGWCDACTDFTNLTKVDIDEEVNETSLSNISHVHYTRNDWQLYTRCVISFFLSDMCLFCCQKCGPRRKLFLWLDIFSKLADHIILTYLRKSLIPDNKIK